MKKFLLALVLALLATPVFAQQPTINGQVKQNVVGCSLVHKDLAVNNQVVLGVPPPPSGQVIYVCGWDWQAVQDATGSAQANVTWTTVNLGGLTQEYSVGATPNAMVSGASYYGFPVKAVAADQPVVFTSPAAVAHTAYSINVYFFYGVP